MDNLLFSINAVAPVFLLILLGIFFRKISLLDEKFISASTKLVFKAALPALIFQKVSSADFSRLLNPREIVFIVLLVSGILLLLFAGTAPFIKDGASRGAFIQGAFRSNIAIVGVAIIGNVFGETGVARTAIALVFIFPMYNIFAVLSLILPQKKKNAASVRDIVRAIISNPLIISVFVALPFSLFSLSPGIIIENGIEYLARMTLPLALLGVGGSLNFTSFKKGFSLALGASLIKLVFYPLAVVLILLATGFRGESLGVIFIMLASPSAVSGYVMANAMGSDSDLAASIILITTLGSAFTIGLGIFIMRSLGLI